MTTAIETLSQVAEECRELEATTPPIRAAWARVASIIRGVPGLRLTKQRTDWSRSHYADPNASGHCGYEYGSLRGIVSGSQSSMVTTEGGQNGGSYVYDDDNDDCLFFCIDGRIYEVFDVEGSWSQWQGSSSRYTLMWREHQGVISDLDDVLDDVQERLCAHRSNLRNRHEAGAAQASRILAALAEC